MLPMCPNSEKTHSSENFEISIRGKPVPGEALVLALLVGVRLLEVVAMQVLWGTRVQHMNPSARLLNLRAVCA